MRKINIAPITQTPKLINHIALVLDASSSIKSYGLVDALIDVAQKQLNHFRAESSRTGQETRVSIYTFADTVTRICFDTNVNLVQNVRDYYRAYGNTALVDGILKALIDLKKIAQRSDEDHAFLLIGLTDGEENESRHSSVELQREIHGSPANYTVSILVPNQRGVDHARRCGFLEGNISVWETTVQGLRETETQLTNSVTAYYSGRASGQRGTKSFYNMPVQNLNKRTLQTQLDVLQPNEYSLYPVFRMTSIKNFVEKRTGKPYRTGSAFYSLTKAEKVQNYKNVLVQEKLTGKVYAGANARKILELPDYEVTVNPASHSKYDLFLQSNSVNRNLVAGTQIIILN